MSHGKYRQKMAGTYQKVWEIDPLICPDCGSEMKIIALIDNKILLKKF